MVIILRGVGIQYGRFAALFRRETTFVSVCSFMYTRPLAKSVSALIARRSFTFRVESVGKEVQIFLDSSLPC